LTRLGIIYLDTFNMDIYAGFFKRLHVTFVVLYLLKGLLGLFIHLYSVNVFKTPVTFNYIQLVK